MPAPVSSLILVADALAARAVRPGQQVPVAVWEVLSTIPDGRGRRGRRHELATVLVVAVAAVLAGSRSLAAIAGWATDLPEWVRPRLGIRRRPPSLSTIRRALIAVDADVLDAVLHAWLAALTPPPLVPAAFRAIAVDGKTCRGALGTDGVRVHLFSAVEHATGIPLGQVRAENKGHEIAAFATVLDRIDLAGVVVTADALHNAVRYVGCSGSRVTTRPRAPPWTIASSGHGCFASTPVRRMTRGCPFSRSKARRSVAYRSAFSWSQPPSRSPRPGGPRQGTGGPLRAREVEVGDVVQLVHLVRVVLGPDPVQHGLHHHVHGLVGQSGVAGEPGRVGQAGHRACHDPLAGPPRQRCVRQCWPGRCPALRVRDSLRGDDVVGHDLTVWRPWAGATPARHDRP